MTPLNAGSFTIYAIVGLLLVCALLAAYRRREAIAQYARWAFVSFGAYLLTIIVLRKFTNDNVKIVLAALLVELLIAARMKPRRSRYIARSEKRKVIERYERRGRRYDPKRHHIDHIVPYSRGGGSRADNLRVLDSEKNLAKSAKAPWWDVFSR